MLGGSGAIWPTRLVACASSGERGPDCIDVATNLVSTSKVAEREAA